MTSTKAGSRDNAAIEANVLDTAMEILLEGGLGALTVQEITKRSGVAKTTIYRRWPSADAIGIDAMRLRFSSTYPAPDTGSLAGDLGVIFPAYREVTAEPGFRRVVLSLLSASTSNPALDEVRVDMEEGRRDLLRPMINAAMKRGEIRPELSFEQIRAIIIGPIFLRNVVDGVEMSDEECEALIPVVCRALG
ncbi:MAG: TetR/AcrR family transcriptional regulator [Acidimicrobiales bacterium]